MSIFKQTMFGAAALLCLVALPQAASANLIVNGGFETPALASNPSLGPTELRPASNYSYPGYTGANTVGGWTYVAGTGLIDTSLGGNAWYGGTPPAGYQGNQFAFVQGGSTSILSTTFLSATAGLAQVSWLEAGRPAFGCCNGDQTYLVKLNGNLVGTYSSTSGQPFTLETGTGLLVAGTNVLSFIGATPANLSPQDQTVFLDQVNVSAVPEPATWAMMIVGFLGMGLVAYRRRSVLRVV